MYDIREGGSMGSAILGCKSEAAKFRCSVLRAQPSGTLSSPRSARGCIFSLVTFYFFSASLGRSVESRSLDLHSARFICSTLC